MNPRTVNPAAPRLSQLARALVLAHRGYVIRTGEVFLTGPAEELRRDPRVIEGYLGG